MSTRACESPKSECQMAPSESRGSDVSASSSTWRPAMLRPRTRRWLLLLLLLLFLLLLLLPLWSRTAAAVPNLRVVPSGWQCGPQKTRDAPGQVGLAKLSVLLSKPMSRGAALKASYTQPGFRSGMDLYCSLPLGRAGASQGAGRQHQ